MQPADVNRRSEREEKKLFYITARDFHEALKKVCYFVLHQKSYQKDHGYEWPEHHPWDDDMVVLKFFSFAVFQPKCLFMEMSNAAAAGAGEALGFSVCQEKFESQIEVPLGQKRWSKKG